MPRLSNEAHETFARVFAARRHFAKAAEAAGSKAVNLSQAGADLYEHPEVYARVRELSEQAIKASGITAERLILEVSRMATVSYQDFYHPDGEQKLPHELTAEQSACVRGTDRNGQYQFWDKNAPVTLLAKHFKLIGDEGDGVNALASALADRLKTARRRALDPNPAGVSGPDDEDLA